MLPYRKKLIEVALPLAKINEAAAREKSIRHGHPSTLHLWWARRPLAACRAVLFASLVDDPASEPSLRRTQGRLSGTGPGQANSQRCRGGRKAIPSQRPFVSGRGPVQSGAFVHLDRFAQ